MICLMRSTAFIALMFGRGSVRCHLSWPDLSMAGSPSRPSRTYSPRPRIWTCVPPFLASLRVTSSPCLVLCGPWSSPTALLRLAGCGRHRVLG
eukprot:6490976-Amphidinium_carterae.1